MTPKMERFPIEHSTEEQTDQNRKNGVAPPSFAIDGCGTAIPDKK